MPTSSSHGFNTLRYLLPFMPIMLGVAVIAGCGAGDSSVPVKGHVTFQGKPVTAGSILFHPEQGRSSMGTILEDGSYELSDEALVGKHTVTIEAYEAIGGAPLPKSYEQELEQGLGSSSAGAPKIKWLVPEEFSSKSTSTLTAEVEAGKTNHIDFDL